MPDSTSETLDGARDVGGVFDQLSLRQRDLEIGANGFAQAMTSAFARSVAGGRQFDDVLKSLTLRLSDLAVKRALQPLTRGLSGGISNLLSGLFGTGGVNTSGDRADLVAAIGAVEPFANGGVISAPTYFPLSPGGLGLAGEAGPEAILPLARGADGRLGVAMSGASGPTSVTINITTPDAESFRRSEVYLTGQIARAVARGQRGL